MEIEEYQVKTKLFKCPNCMSDFTKSILKEIPETLGEVVYCPTCRKKVLWYNEKLYQLTEV